MNDWRGIEYASVSDPRARVALAEIHDFLFQLSPAIARLGKGQKPDSSGDTIGALDDYFFLPGRLSPQTGYFGTAAGASAGFLSSTKHTTKGKWFFNSARTMVVDEANVLLGIGTASPAAVGHFKGNPQPAVVQAVADRSNNGWQLISAATAAAGLLTSDGTTSYVSHIDANGTFDLVLDPGVVLSTSTDTWTFTINARRTGAVSTDTTVSIGVARSSGNAVFSAELPVQANFTTSFADYTFTVTFPALGETPPAANSFILRARTSPGSGTGNRVDVTYLALTSGSGTSSAIVTQERTAATTLPYSKWLNESGATVASVNASAQMVARGFVMTDPAGSDADTIIHQAPASITQQTLTWPGTITASGVLQVSADGTLFWTAPSSLATRIQHRWMANGVYKTDDFVDGAYIAPHAFSLTKTSLHRRVAGTSGTTTVALQRNGTTIDNRSLLFSAGANAVDTSGTLALAIAAGDRLTINATAEAGTPRDFAFMIEGN